MKIGINAAVLGHEDTGVEIWTRGLIGALARQDRANRYVVYVRRGVDPFGGEDVPPNFEVFRMPGPSAGRMPRIMWEQMSLPRLARGHGLDVLHCPAYVAPYGPGVPMVLTLHDLFVYTHPGQCRLINRLHFRVRMPHSVRQAARIHCTSHWTRSCLCSQFPAAGPRARVVHPGVDEMFRPLPPREVERYRREHAFPRAPFLFVGNPEPKKNIEMLLHAFMLLRHRYDCERQLMLVGGEGWASMHVDDLIDRLGIVPHVTRTGYVPRGELPFLYANSLALVFPSVIEGFGLPPLEAMACGIPVITTAAGGLPESVGGAAVRLNEADATTLADSMHRLEQSPELRLEHVRAGLRRARMFRWEKLADQYVRIYREAATA